MTSINFRYEEDLHQLESGACFSRPAAEAFQDTASTDISDILTEMSSGKPWRDVVRTKFGESNPWLEQIILSPKRTAYFDSLLPSEPGVALDIGCGWGQMTRPLAEKGWTVAALEPSEDRMSFVRSSAQQDGLDDRISFITTDYLDTHFETHFDLCLCIGVFEWIGAFQDQQDPLIRQRQFLRKAKQELRPGGSLIIGIENRLGLKYLLGTPDDHIGEPSVAFLPAELAMRRWSEKTGNTLKSFTYTDAELRALLSEAGFTTIEFFASLPDYKLPDKIIPLTANGREFNDFVSTGKHVPEHNGYDGTKLSPIEQENLSATYASMAMQGIAHHFAPSFFVRAS